MKISCIIELPEYETKEYGKDDIPEHIGKLIFDKYNKQVNIEFPTYKSANMWRLTNKGWVGYIPLQQDYGLSLKPKVSINNLFKMWEYAYKLKSFEYLDGITECDSIEGFYERLASILADLVLDRGRKGYYREYKDESCELSYISGRIDLNNIARKSWQPKVLCHYQEHTGDISENQVITWTLHTIAQSGICSERVLSKVRAAYRNLQNVASLESCTYKDCINRLYNRLNQDYQPMHILCRFFLEHCGPSLDSGEHIMLPFLVNMARLYELFISEWLKAKLPEYIQLKTQERVQIGDFGELSFLIDLVLYDVSSMNAIAVLDTKYKNPDTPSQADINQIVTYALSQNVNKAILVYPGQLKIPFTWGIKGILVQSQTFDIGQDLDQAGEYFLKEILEDSSGT